jgi:hypothetical protein
MGFETRVLNKVSDILGNDKSASFTSGTLFVNCDAKEAAKLETALIAITNGGVVVSKTPAEFAFDFVA